MTVLKCKMCGGDIEVNASQTYGKCDHCGTTSTLPKADDEQKANLFNRANHFRRQNDFDKAITAYEAILNSDNSSSEAHWGIVLSKYGIEYVEDPISHERVPTCHRVQNESILVDADYLAALEHSEDSYTKSLYEAEAKRIGEIQKDILSISTKEKPYDVFICYKETNDSGTRKKDSTMAQDIYYQLENEGFKVFFSRITLEDKLGQQYEPYIFAALHSAKVMVVIGTKREYFNAVWVKNEWSRYLALMKKDKNRLLIPCYCEMDAYDLPEELSMLQSQDMSKIGFIQDLIRGIKKVLTTDNSSQGGNTKISGDAGITTPGVAQFLDRASIFLEDGDFKSANEYFDRVLDLEPRNAKAYFGKLLASFGYKKEDDILLQTEHLDEHSDYQKAVRFADGAYKQKLEGYNITIKQKLEEHNLAIKREQEEYNNSITKIIVIKRSYKDAKKNKLIGNTGIMSTTKIEFFIDNEMVFDFMGEENQEYIIKKGRHTIYCKFPNDEQSNIIEFEAGSNTVYFELYTSVVFFKNICELIILDNPDQIAAYINNSDAKKIFANEKGRFNYIVKDGTYVERRTEIAVIYGSFHFEFKDGSFSGHYAGIGQGDPRAVIAITNGNIHFLAPDNSIVKEGQAIARIDVTQ
jgi:tetratricopeptide (TPR) repeat protein